MTQTDQAETEGLRPIIAELTKAATASLETPDERLMQRQRITNCVAALLSAHPRQASQQGEGQETLPTRNVIAAGKNLLGVIENKQWERLDSKAEALRMALKLLEAGNG